MVGRLRQLRRSRRRGWPEGARWPGPPEACIIVPRRSKTTPIDFEIDEAAGIVWSVAHGTLTAEELVEFGRSLFAEPKLPSPYRGLCDLRDVTRFEGSTAAIRALASLAKSSPARAPGGRLAFVTGSASLFGLSRMYELLSDTPGFETRIFQDEMDAALSWLAE